MITPGTLLLQNLRLIIDNRCTVKCYLGSFADGIQPDWNNMPHGKCTCSKLKEPEVRRESLRQALEEARALHADVVVLPELSLCPEMRHFVCDWLQNEHHPFCMVVPGSFHEEPDSEGVPVNRTRLLDAQGYEVLTHEKRIPFGTDKVCDEVIRPGKRLRLLRTPLGLVALAICRDFLEKSAANIELWEMVAPDWVFVPSMSPIQGVGAHEDQAQFLSNCCGTRSLVPNQCPHGTYEPIYPGDDGNSHGFASWPDLWGKFQLQTIVPTSRLAVIPI
ncbi:MAG: hypothetical protein HQL74_13940 [Magnetococcales bacterium]|nr:hypothetical protein [Magnetococcales bacterium]